MATATKNGVTVVEPRYRRFRDIPPFTRGSSYQVNVGWDYLETMLEHYSEGPGGIDMDPDFQRAHVWTEQQQIRYVEFRLREGHSGKDIYWNCSTWQAGFNTPVVLVDGKQRLEAVRRFMRDEIPAFGTLKSEYEDKLRLVCVDFIFHVNNLATRREVLQWYLDINAGGVIHTEDELARVRELLAKETAA